MGYVRRTLRAEWRAITHLLTQAGVNVVGQLGLFQFLVCTCIVRVLDLRMLNVTGFAICCMIRREAQTGT